jgi:hypothetical protein
MELVDHFRPLGHQRLAVVGRLDRVPADLDQPVAMAFDLAAEMVDQHLRAKADAEEGLVLPERDLQPFGLAADEFVLVVGAHRAAEHDRAGMMRKRLRQLVAERRAADVEIEAGLDELVADAPRARLFLVQHDEDPLPRPFQSRH